LLLQSIAWLKKKSACKDGKKAKEWITVLFIANAAGEKETPIVIGNLPAQDVSKVYKINVNHWEFLIFPMQRLG